MPQVIVSTKSPRAGSSVPSPGGSRVRTPQARPQGGPIPQISIADATAAERGKAAAAESLGKAGVDLTNFGVKLLKAKNDLVAATEVIRLKGDAAGSLQKLTFDLENRQPGEQDILGHEELMIQGIQDRKEDLLGRAKTQEGKAAVEAYFLREEPRMVIGARVFELKREADIGRAGLAVAIDAAKERAVRATGQEFDKEIGFIRSSYDGALKARIITAEAHQKGIKKAGNDIAFGKFLTQMLIDPERAIKDIKERKVHFKDEATRARALALAIKAKGTREAELDRKLSRAEAEERRRTKEDRAFMGGKIENDALLGKGSITVVQELLANRKVTPAAAKAAIRIMVREDQEGNESKMQNMMFETYQGKVLTVKEMADAITGEDPISKKQGLRIRALEASQKKGAADFHGDATYKEGKTHIISSFKTKGVLDRPDPTQQALRTLAIADYNDLARAAFASGKKDYIAISRGVVERYRPAIKKGEESRAEALTLILKPWIDKNEADPARAIVEAADKGEISEDLSRILLRHLREFEGIIGHRRQPKPATESKQIKRAPGIFERLTDWLKE